MSETTNQQAPAFTPAQEALLRRLAEQARARMAEQEAQAQPDPLAEAEAGALEPSVQPTGPEPERPGLVRRVLGDIGTGLMEAPGQILRGAVEGIDAAAEGLRSLAVGTGLVSQEFADRNPATPVAPNIGIGEAQSVTGAIVNDVSQFAVGFLGASRLLRAAGMGAGVMRGAAAGAVADATVFRAHEERLSNLIERYPALSNPVTRYLAADPNDSEAEGRFKNAVEGLIAGGVLEGLFHSIRSIRAARRGNMEEAAQAAEEAAQAAPPPRDPLTDPEAARAMDQEAQLELPLEGGGMRMGDQAQAMRDNPTADTLAGVQPSRPTYAPRIEMDEAGLRDVVQQSIREHGYGQGRNISGIRTDLIENNGDLNATMSALRVVYREQMEAMGEVGRVRPLEEVRRNADALADLIGGDPDLILQRLQGQFDNLAHADAEVTMYRDFLATIHDRVVRYARALNDPRGGDLAGFATRQELAEQFRRHVELMGNVQALYKGVQTNVARALNAMRLPANVNADLARNLQDIETMAARFAMADNVAQTARLTRGGWVRNATGAINEYFINSILSGPKTQVVNVVTNMAMSTLQPAERMIAGAIHFNREEFLQGGLQYLGMAQSMREAMSLAARALREGDPILDPFRSTVELHGQAAISAQRLGLHGGVMAPVVDFLGGVVRLPSRLLMTQDEFFKQLTYRSRIRAAAWQEALGSGLQWGSREFGEFVQRRLDGAFNADGTAAHAQALEAARNVTFTDDLAAQTWSGGRTLGESLQSMTGNHPFVQIVMPFVRTPTNIARFVWNRTPGLNVLRAQYQNDLLGRNGTEAAMRARSQMVTGGLLWGTAVTYALSGDITGGGPSDPSIRRQLQATGWQPYSFRIENPDGTVTYRAFDRMDPFATFMAAAADFAEAASFMGEREVDQLATDMTVALARQLSNKTYLSGLVRAMGALAEPDRRGERFAQGLAGSFMPSFVAQALRDDPNMREVRSLLDAIRARTPGSADMDPVRNVLGEAVATPAGYGPDWISPIAETTRPGGAQPITREWRHTVQDRVHDEIARQLVHHNSSLRPPAPKLYGEVDLREWRHPETGRTAYDRYQALVGEVEINGARLREALSDLIHSDEYRNVASDGSFDHDGSRIDLIRRVIGYYRQAAEVQLREEMPDLDDALYAAEARRNLIRVQ